MAARWSQPGPLQAALLEALAAADGPMTAAALYDATGMTSPSNRRAVRASITAMEARGWVTVEREAVVGYDGAGPAIWREPEPGEEPTYRAGDRVPGDPGREFTADVVPGRQARPITGTVVELTDAGRRAISRVPST